MKTLIFTIATVITASTFAQNPIVSGLESFENWTSNSVGEMPNEWDGFNREVIFNGMSVGEVECVKKDSITAKDGNYAVVIRSESVMGGPAVPGLFTTGNLNINWNNQDGTIDGGEAFSLRPTQLKGWYKYYPVNSDTASIEIGFSNNTIEMGGGIVEVSGLTEEWTEFILDISYTNNDTPDTMNIAVASTIKSENIPEGSEIHLDALEFVYGTSGIQGNEESKIKIYPNPVENHLFIEGLSTITNEIHIFNSLGQKFESIFNPSNTITINVETLNPGIYFLQIENNGNKELHKIQVK